MYDQWYESIFVYTVFQREFPLRWHDVSDRLWTEIDTVDDLLLAKRIFELDEK